MNLEKRLKIIYKAAFSIMGSTGGLPPSSLKMTKSSLIKGQSPLPSKSPQTFLLEHTFLQELTFHEGGNLCLPTDHTPM